MSARNWQVTVSLPDIGSVRSPIGRVGEMLRVQTADLLVHDAELIATVDDTRRRSPGVGRFDPTAW